MNKAVTQMDQVVQSNAAQTEELSSTAQALSTQADQLQALVARFKLDNGVGGESRYEAAASMAGFAAKSVTTPVAGKKPKTKSAGIQKRGARAGGKTRPQWRWPHRQGCQKF